MNGTQSAPAPVVSPAAGTLDATTSVTTSSSGAVAPTVDMQPRRTETTSVINRPLLITGFLLLGGTYGASAIVGAESDRKQDNPNLYYPIVGPWMDLGQRGGGQPGFQALLILDGVGQGLGALSMVTSLFIPEKTTKAWYLIGNEKAHFAPTAMGRSGYGMFAGGTF